MALFLTGLRHFTAAPEKANMRAVEVAHMT